MDETRKWLAMGIGYGVGVALGLTLGTAGAQVARQVVERRESRHRALLDARRVHRELLGTVEARLADERSEPVEAPEADG